MMFMKKKKHCQPAAQWQANNGKENGLCAVMSLVMKEKMQITLSLRSS